MSGVMAGWLGYMIFAARDRLGHDGVGPGPVGAAAGWLAVATGVAYLVLAVLAALRRGPVHRVVLILLAPALLCALYALGLAADNTHKAGFPVVPLISVAAVAGLCAITAAVRSIAHARR